MLNYLFKILERLFDAGILTTDVFILHKVECEESTDFAFRIGRWQLGVGS
jgi:hypothetical protein